MRLPSVTFRALEEIGEVARRRDAIPTDKELAVKHDLTPGYVRQLMRRARQPALTNICDVSCGTTVGDTAAMKLFGGESSDEASPV